VHRRSHARPPSLAPVTLLPTHSLDRYGEDLRKFTTHSLRTLYETRKRNEMTVGGIAFSTPASIKSREFSFG